MPSAMIRQVLLLAAVALLPDPGLAQTHGPEIERALAFAQRIENKVFRSTVEPHWLPGGKRLWYRVQTGPDAWEYVLADAESGRITRAEAAAALDLPVQRLTTSTDTTTEVHASR